MMLIEILGLDVQFKEVSLPKRQHYEEEYLNKNPLHTIPMLEDGDFIIVDSHPIMTYLVSKYDTESSLYPKNLKARCLVDQRLYFDATILFPRLRNVVYSLKYSNERTTSVTDLQQRDIEEAYGVLEKYLQGSSFVAGDKLSVADLSCVASVSSLHAIVPVGLKYVNINEWWNKLKGEVWYEAKNVPGAKIFEMFMTGMLRNN